MCDNSLAPFFSGLGFSKTSDSSFKFQKLSAEEAASTTDPLQKMKGNLKVLSHAVKVFADKQQQLKNPAAYNATKAKEEAKTKLEVQNTEVVETQKTAQP